MDSFQEKYNVLVIKYDALLAENEELKSILSQHGIVYSSIKRDDESTAFSSIIYPPIKLSLDEKIALFRNFFKGRDDVFARRWFNKATEKGGYQPVCINEWRRGICDKKKHKCAECPNRNFATLTNQDIYRHLEGKDENGCDVIGLYVVTSDNKCSFLCADSHVELLAEMLKQHVANIIQLTGEGTAKNKRETLQKLQDIPKDAPLVIVATGKYVGEGFDYPRLDTLFLALPISWKGLVAQYAGRLHRENEGKKDVRIYDYIDIHEPVCENMYRKRLKGYSAIGYRVLSKDTQTLFDNTDDLQTSSYEGQIFNGNTFRLAFMQNLKSSRQSIVISSPKLYRTERNTFVKMLREFHVSGVQIAILTSEESSQTNYLKSLGLYVKIVPKLSLSSCIIDRSTVWYGSINILGYVTEEDNIIKITDGKLANELLDVIYDSPK